MLVRTVQTIQTRRTPLQNCSQWKADRPRRKSRPPYLDFGRYICYCFVFQPGCREKRVYSHLSVAPPTASPLEREFNGATPAIAVILVFCVVWCTTVPLCCTNNKNCRRPYSAVCVKRKLLFPPEGQLKHRTALTMFVESRPSANSQTIAIIIIVVQ